MRQRMVRFGHANLRIRPRALFLADHERNRHASGPTETPGAAGPASAPGGLRRPAARPGLLDCRQLDVTLLFGSLDTSLDVANRIRVFVDLVSGPAGRAPSSASPACPFTESRMLLCCCSRASRDARSVVPLSPKSLLEHRARVALHRQGLGRAAPRNRVRVRAAQIAGAGAGIRRSVHGQLQRGELGLFGEVTRHQLVDGNVCDDFDFRSSTARRAGQEGSRSAGVDVVPAGLEARRTRSSDPDTGRVAPGWESARSRRPTPFGDQYSIAIPFGV